MSAIALLCSGLLVALALASGLALARSTSARPQLGWAAVSCYLGIYLAALAIWGRDMEGVSIITLLGGMPWSGAAGAALNSIFPGGPDLLGIRWESLILALSTLSIGANCWLVYQIGRRLPLPGLARVRA